MAITKIWKVRNRLRRSVEYIMNPDKTNFEFDTDAVEKTERYILNSKKTENMVYVRAYNCSKGKASEEMLKTQKRYGKDKSRKGIVAYHLVQSFKDFETTPEIAHQCGMELAEKLFAGRYEVVVATHVDHKHLHNHLIFNAVSFVDGKKYRNNFSEIIHHQKKTPL